MTRTTIAQLLADARRRLDRLDPLAAFSATREGAVLIDIRADSQIARDGIVAEALLIPRNELEWRLDPTSEHRHRAGPTARRSGHPDVQRGYQSSLAAATLQQLGFARATDLAGGFKAWREAGLPYQEAGQM